jgi:hypothetical protein
LSVSPGHISSHVSNRQHNPLERSADESAIQRLAWRVVGSSPTAGAKKCLDVPRRPAAAQEDVNLHQDRERPSLNLGLTGHRCSLSGPPADAPTGSLSGCASRPREWRTTGKTYRSEPDGSLRSDAFQDCEGWSTCRRSARAHREAATTGPVHPAPRQYVRAETAPTKCFQSHGRGVWGGLVRTVRIGQRVWGAHRHDGRRSAAC